MGSTVRSLGGPITLQAGSGTLRWRSWPLVDHPWWSWCVPLAMLAAGAFVFWLGGGWFVAVVAVAALALVLWQFLLPVQFEVTSLGLRRYALGRIRLVPWQAIRAYQLRPTGIAFFQRAEPAKLDSLSAFFVPYPADEDELVVAVRLYLPHAAELTA